MKRLSTLLLLTLLPLAPLVAQTPEEQAARAARSVHLAYRNYGANAQVFYLEATVDQIHPGSYICLLGFNAGYAGIQLLNEGKRVAIFSVWEPASSDKSVHPDNPNTKDFDRHTKELFHGEGVRIKRFGGEGTGGQSMMDWAWKMGEPVRMAVSCVPDGANRTAYTGWIWDDTRNAWSRIATFSSLLGKGKGTISSPYSFLEDFMRNVKSKAHVRAARFSRLWAWDGSNWTPCSSAQFTADSNALTTIDAGPAANGFWLATGGETANVTTKLWGTITPGGVPDDSADRRAKLIQAVNAIR